MKFGFSARLRLVVFGGGLPLRVAGELIGGIGVSGASRSRMKSAPAPPDAIGAE